MKKGMGRRCCGAGSRGLGAGHGRRAQDELGSVKVVSAAGYEQKLTDAPASISVISQEELHSRPFTSAIDAVRELEGVDVGETRDKTGQSTISMRGMGADYTLILIDGRRQNNHGDIYPNNFGGNQFNHIPPLEAIERIEVIRGPASTLYGADAMGGVINIITKKSTPVGRHQCECTIQEYDEYGDASTTDFSSPARWATSSVWPCVAACTTRMPPTRICPVTDPNGVVHERELGFGSGGEPWITKIRLWVSRCAGPPPTTSVSRWITIIPYRPMTTRTASGTTDSPEGLPRAGYARIGIP